MTTPSVVTHATLRTSETSTLPAHRMTRPAAPASVLLAPPGSGKSTLLRRWAAAETGRSTVWLDLAESRASLTETQGVSPAPIVFIDHLERLAVDHPLLIEARAVIARGGVATGAAPSVAPPAGAPSAAPAAPPAAQGAPSGMPRPPSPPSPPSPPAPPGVDPDAWQYMTPEERALWQN